MNNNSNYQDKNNQEMYMKCNDTIEPILDPANASDVLTYKDKELYDYAVEYYDKQLNSFWVPGEIDWTGDISTLNLLKPNELKLIQNILMFFAFADNVVSNNLAENFVKDIQILPIKQALLVQAAMETVHSRTYADALDVFVPNQDQRDAMLRDITSNKGLNTKKELMARYSEPTSSPPVNFAERLLVFACVEGIWFSSSFCVIFWLKKRGLMPGLTFSNELISRDEGMHCTFALTLYKKLKNRCSLETERSIFTRIVDAEVKFMAEAIPTELLGLSKQDVKQYVHYVADTIWNILQEGSVNLLYKQENPFEWMELISLQGKTNFFERRVSEYRKCAAVDENRSANTKTIDDDNFITDADF